MDKQPIYFKFVVGKFLPQEKPFHLSRIFIFLFKPFRSVLTSVCLLLQSYKLLRADVLIWSVNTSVLKIYFFGYFCIETTILLVSILQDLLIHNNKYRKNKSLKYCKFVTNETKIESSTFGTINFRIRFFDSDRLYERTSLC